jgi:RNA polymerase sigma factor (sigma-70 family)
VALPPFQTFLDDQRDTVLRFLVATVGFEEAEDCFQETFVSALRAYPRLEEGSNLRAWVLTIAHRKALDMFRARKRRPLPVEELPEMPAAPEPSLNGNSEVWAAARELPAKQREALLYRFAADLPYADVAEVLDTSEEAARQRVSEALKNLRKAWQS